MEDFPMNDPPMDIAPSDDWGDRPGAAFLRDMQSRLHIETRNAEENAAWTRFANEFLRRSAGNAEQGPTPPRTRPMVPDRVPSTYATPLRSPDSAWIERLARETNPQVPVPMSRTPPSYGSPGSTYPNGASRLPPLPRMSRPENSEQGSYEYLSRRQWDSLHNPWAPIRRESSDRMRTSYYEAPSPNSTRRGSPERGNLPSLHSVSAFIADREARKLDQPTPVNPLVDLRALDFVEKPSENLICTICAAPFVEPMELGCEHIFCADCIYEHLSCGLPSASNCPKCRSPLEILKPVSKLLNQLLDELETYCPNASTGSGSTTAKDGCEDILKRYTVVNHISKYCGFEEIPCSERGCEGTVQRRYQARKCLHTPLECDVCGESWPEKDLEIHQKDGCPASRVDCEYCNITMRRHHMPKHLDTECPSVEIACSGQVYGCPHVAPRHSISSHEESCPISLMTSHLTSVEERSRQSEAENGKLRQQVDYLTSRLTSLEDSHRKLSASLKKERRRSLAYESTAVSASSSRIDDLQAKIDDLTLEYTARLDSANSEAASLRIELLNTQSLNAQRFHGVNGTLTHLRSQLLHLLRTTGPAGGVAASSGVAVAAAGAAAPPITGQSAGAGLSLDSARREPPKL